MVKTVYTSAASGAVKDDLKEVHMLLDQAEKSTPAEKIPLMIENILTLIQANGVEIDNQLLSRIGELTLDHVTPQSAANIPQLLLPHLKASQSYFTALPYCFALYEDPKDCVSALFYLCRTSLDSSDVLRDIRGIMLKIFGEEEMSSISGLIQTARKENKQLISLPGPK